MKYQKPAYIFVPRMSVVYFNVTFIEVYTNEKRRDYGLEDVEPNCVGVKVSIVISVLRDNGEIFM
jgi:hypothetical protein